MKVTRKSVFETNSSSTHSFSMGSKRVKESPIDSTIKFGEFGWGYEKLSSPTKKASYLFTLIQYLDKNIRAIEYPPYGDKSIKEHDKEVSEYEKERFEMFLKSKYYRWIKGTISDVAKKDVKVEILDDDFYPMGYIDHQSLSPCIFQEIFDLTKAEFECRIKEVIFGDGTIIIDNDNR